MNRVRELRNKIGKLGSSRKGVRELRNSAANFMGLSEQQYNQLQECGEGMEQQGNGLENTRINTQNLF